MLKSAPSGVSLQLAILPAAAALPGNVFPGSGVCVTKFQEATGPMREDCIMIKHRDRQAWRRW